MAVSPLIPPRRLSGAAALALALGLVLACVPGTVRAAEDWLPQFPVTDLGALGIRAGGEIDPMPSTPEVRSALYRLVQAAYPGHVPMRTGIGFRIVPDGPPVACMAFEASEIDCGETAEGAACTLSGRTLRTLALDPADERTLVARAIVRTLGSTETRVRANLARIGATWQMAMPGEDFREMTRDAYLDTAPEALRGPSDLDCYSHQVFLGEWAGALGC